MAVDLFELLRPSVEGVGVELVDVEFRSGVLQVTVDRDGGVDLEALTAVNRVVSAELDVTDPIPGTYSLEVSSPGIERPLRRPAHFTRAVGQPVTVKTRPQVEGDRRRRGRLVAADDEGFEVEVDGARVRLGYGDVDSVRTVFEWGGQDKPGARTGAPGGSKRTSEKRKQVVTP
jgi:ribosome maturation factor RimP